jgi:hypothetical protein
MKKGKPLFSPLNFNVVAVFWIVAVVPLAVAWVSNLGSDVEGDKDYQQITVSDKNCLIYNDCTPISQGGTVFSNYSGLDMAWVQNGGDDYSTYYALNNPNLEPEYNLDCSYIKNGLCYGAALDPADLATYQALVANGSHTFDCDEYYGVIPPGYLGYLKDLQYNCDFADPYWFNLDPITGLTYFNFQFDGSNFYRGTDSHGHAFSGAPSANITDDSYIGDSGDVFSFRLNERMMNQFPQGEMVDSLRFTVLDYPDAPLANPTSYNCGAHPWDNFTIETKLIQQFDGNENVIDGYITSTWNKYYFASSQPTYFTAGCYHGWEIIIDFNGIDTRSMFNFVDGGKWNESTMVIEWTIEMDDNFPIGTRNVAINGVDDFIIAIDYAMIPAQQVETATNIGLLTLSAGNVILAMASTPYWDPFRNFFKGKF